MSTTSSISDGAGAIVAAAARVLGTLAVLALLFAAHQYWGTDVRTAWEQDRLRAGLEGSEGVGATGAQSDVLRPAAVVSGAGLGLLPGGTGAPLGRLAIERIGLDVVVVDGVSREDLQRGPGHLPGTPLPGARGNSVVTGHRTTWGAPFGRLDELRAGDRVTWTAGATTVTYQVVAGADGEPARVIEPVVGEVLGHDEAVDQLTLVTCHPRFSAAERLVVVAQRMSPGTEPGAEVVAEVTSGGPVPRPVSLFDQDPPVRWVDVVAPASVVAALLVLGEALSRRAAGRARRWRASAWRAAAWLITTPALLVTFDRLADLMPEGI